ncbi:MAG: hypothetical protein ABIK28_17630, partial [Planctomycetota bacterium]
MIVLVLTGSLFSQTFPSKERPALIRIDLAPDAETVTLLQEADLDIACIGRTRDEGIQVVADASDLAWLDRIGIPYTLLHDDLIAFYQSGLDDRLAREKDLGSMGGYYTFAEVCARLDAYRATFPNLITQKISIGKSRENRDLWAVKISD